MRLRARYPGRDGGKKGRRFEKVSVKALPQPTSSRTKAIRELVLSVCVQALRQRESSPGATESAVKCHLESTYQQFTSKYASNMQRLAAPYVPSTFKEALTLLESEADLKWPTLLRYDRCPCGFVYRCEHAEAVTCPARKPGNPQQPCSLPRTAGVTRSVIYNSLAQFLERVYADPIHAEEFSSWQLPNPRSRELSDIFHGAAFSDAVRADPGIVSDKRNVFCVLITDPYKVSLQLMGGRFWVWVGVGTGLVRAGAWGPARGKAHLCVGRGQLPVAGAGSIRASITAYLLPVLVTYAPASQ